MILSPPNRPLTWLLTGCSSGLGLSLARLALSHHQHVLATSRNPARTPHLVAEIEQKGGRWLTLDLEDAHCEDLIDKLENEGTHVDVLVNNAGYSVLGVVEAQREEEVRKMMEVMFFAPGRLVRKAVKGMRERRGGVVVNVSSGAGLEGREGMGGYASAKAAGDAMSKVLAKEVAPFNVRVLTVSLGGFDTSMSSAATQGENPMPDDYKGSAAEKVVDAIAGGGFEPDGDKEKATKAMYEVVMGEGVGKGREGERFLPLGRDLAKRVEEVREGLGHAMEIFGEVCNNVYREK